MSLLEEALEKHPEFSKLWMMRGQIEEQQGNIAVAREVYNKAVSASLYMYAHLHIPTCLVCAMCVYVCYCVLLS